jgi:peptidyl-prolyl cis-trans isomerase SurA
MFHHRIFFPLLFTFFSLLPAQQKIDGIIAVIGDEIILQSELNAYTVLRLSNLGLSQDSVDMKKYQTRFINELIDGKVLLAYGKKDSTISVSNEEVEQATNNHIAMLLRQNNLTLDSLEVELQRQQGISLVKFKTDARKAIREQLLKQKVQQSYLYSGKITKKDVEAFYKEFIDSLPKMGESVLLSKLSIKISPSEAIRQKAYDQIQSLKQRLDNGADFADVAKKFSQGPEASEGGDLGFIAKGTLSELAFEEKAFSLSQGQTSDPFETRLGFHIINVLEKRDQKVHIRQIFISVEPPQEEIDRITAKLDSIRTYCKTGKDFISLVKKYSDDPVSKVNNGLMKWSSVLELPSDIRSAIDSLPIGSISQPVHANQTISIYRIEDRANERVLTLDDDYLILEKKASDIYAQKKMIDLVSKWRKDIYIDIRL